VGLPDEARKTCLLEFFTDHFVAMAKESNRKRAYGHGLMYVMQAENLLQLLGEDNSRYSHMNTLNFWLKLSTKNSIIIKNMIISFSYILIHYFLAHNFLSSIYKIRKKIFILGV